MEFDDSGNEVFLTQSTFHENYDDIDTQGVVNAVDALLDLCDDCNNGVCTGGHTVEYADFSNVKENSWTVPDDLFEDEFSGDFPEVSLCF